MFVIFEPGVVRIKQGDTYVKSVVWDTDDLVADIMTSAEIVDGVACIGESKFCNLDRFDSFIGGIAYGVSSLRISSFTVHSSGWHYDNNIRDLYYMGKRVVCNNNYGVINFGFIGDVRKVAWCRGKLDSIRADVDFLYVEVLPGGEGYFAVHYRFYRLFDIVFVVDTVLRVLGVFTVDDTWVMGVIGNSCRLLIADVCDDWCLQFASKKVLLEGAGWWSGLVMSS